MIDLSRGADYAFSEMTDAHLHALHYSDIFGTTWPNFTKFLCMLALAVVRSSCGVAIFHVLSVL